MDLEAHQPKYQDQSQWPFLLQDRGPIDCSHFNKLNIEHYSIFLLSYQIQGYNNISLDTFQQKIQDHWTHFICSKQALNIVMTFTAQTKTKLSELNVVQEELKTLKGLLEKMSITNNSMPSSTNWNHNTLTAPNHPQTWKCPPAQTASAPWRNTSSSSLSECSNCCCKGHIYEECQLPGGAKERVPYPPRMCHYCKELECLKGNCLILLQQYQNS